MNATDAQPTFPAEGNPCPACGYCSNAATDHLNPDARPGNDDLSICLACGALAVFNIIDQIIRIRPATDEERIEFLKDQNVIDILWARQLAADNNPDWPSRRTSTTTSNAISQLTAALAELISISNIAYANEDDLQAGIHELLQTHVISAGPKAVREMRLSDGVSRIDLFCEGVGIEVKIKGSSASVDRQLARYAKCPEIQSLILVTTKAMHHATPRVVNGKTVALVLLIEGGL